MPPLVNLMNSLHLASNSTTNSERSEHVPVDVLSGRKRRSFFRKDRPIPPFNTPLKHATFQLSETNTTCNNMVTQNGIDFMWLLQTFTNTTPLYYGYLSRYVRDHPPCTLVTYVDPISLPLTKNDGVCETMVRTIQVSKEMKQKYAIVTYDLAVALKIYCIQAV